jgi:acyl-CoA synthetase (AMP-forming)/AMP-acid ligase II
VAACLVLREPHARVRAEIEAFATTRLARFEVPTRWWFRREPLPTTPSGKVLKSEVIRRWPGNDPEAHTG